MKESEKNRGVSLIYVLIVLSIITVFSFNFMYFVREKVKINSLVKSERKVSKSFLIQKEEENLERIMKKGIYFNNENVNLETREKYFDSNIGIDNLGKTELKKLIYLSSGFESVGGYRIKEVMDEDGNKYGIPLKENEVYRNLKIIYSRKVLGEEIEYEEKISFRRKSLKEIEITIIESKFL